MTFAELKTRVDRVFEYIQKNRIRNALESLRFLCNQGKNLDFSNQLENHTETYLNMLRYSFELSDDPQKELVYNRLVKAIIGLADDVREDIIRSGNLLQYYQMRIQPETRAEEVIAGLSRRLEHLVLQQETGDTDGTLEELNSPDYKQSVRDLFQVVWQADTLKDTEIGLLEKISRGTGLAWHDKCVVVSALTLSTLRHFDSNKIHLLFSFYESGEKQVWQRALVGLVLCLAFYDARLRYYPDILQRLKAIQGLRQADRTIGTIIIQFLKARETEKITRKIQQDILPEMMRMRSKLEERLDLENLFSQSASEDKNPEWETFFKDSPDVYKKLEEFTNLQVEGADVFLGAFAMLKQFDFFNEVSNWFTPFYKENEYLARTFGDVSEGFDVKQFAEGIERSNFLCNSDKYSFCLNVRHLPAFQKSTVMELFNMELKAMNELAQDDELIHAEAADRVIITQYFQDLYRFYKLHPLKHEFDDVFNLPVRLHDATFFRIWVEDTRMLRNIGEFYFEKNEFTDARAIFMQIVEQHKSYELLEKIGYCYQKEGRYQEALEAYHKAELLDGKRIWLLTKIAWCCRKTGLYDEAVEYYREAEKEEPENLEIQAWLGQTMMEAENFEEALKYYFKVEYLNPANHKVHRPIAWCCFMLGRLDMAKKYLEKSLSVEVTKNDFLNMGHICWCMNDKPSAIEYYRKSLRTSGMDLEWFAKTIMEDSPQLIHLGIHGFDIPLMIDYIMMSAVR